jgi:hypothetical protein
MKKLLLLLLLLLPGCTTLSETQIQASQANQLISAVGKPNPVSAGLLGFQNYNRDINATLQNPWNGFFTLRNLWLH